MKLIDGGLSTELERIGANLGDVLWTGQTILETPHLVQQAHRNYVAAGAEVVISSSYQLSRAGFLEVGRSAAAADDTLRKSIELARSATEGSQAQVAASVGPYGAILHDGSEYRGDYKVSQNQLEDFHFERLNVLIAAKPDLLAIETIPNVLEARALANVLREVDLPYWFSFTAGTGSKLHSGEYVEEAAEQVADLENLMAVGVNCVNPALVSELVTRIHSVTSKSAVAYPNRGGTWDSAAGAWLGSERNDLADWFDEWQDLPIGWLGGCCGTDALSIAELQRRLERFQQGE